MNLSEMFVGGLIGAILGIFLNYAVKITIGWINLKKSLIYEGIWFSTWQPKYEKHPEWVHEKLQIDRKLNRLIFVNSMNDAGYTYKAKAKLIKQNYIVGDFDSTLPESNAHGVFLLSISNQGNCLYGYWMGPNYENDLIIGAYVIGRTEKDVEVGKRLLVKKTLNLNES